MGRLPGRKNEDSTQGTAQSIDELSICVKHQLPSQVFILVSDPSGMFYCGISNVRYNGTSASGRRVLAQSNLYPLKTGLTPSSVAQFLVEECYEMPLVCDERAAAHFAAQAELTKDQRLRLEVKPSEYLDIYPAILDRAEYANGKKAGRARRAG